MKTKEILKQFEKGLKCINKAHTLPILDCFYFNKGKVISSDLEYYYLFSLPETANLHAVIDGKKLVNILKKLPQDQEVFFENNPETYVFTIKTEKGIKFSLTGYKPDDYPVLPDAFSDEDEKPAEVFKGIGRLSEEQTELFFKAVKYVAKDELRPTLNAVYIDKSHVVASDAHKLCFYKEDSFLDHPIMLGEKMQNLLEPCKPYAVYESAKWLQFHYENSAIYMRKIEGEYPTWKGVIPENQDKYFTCEGKALADLLNLSLNVNENLARFSCDEFGVEIKSQNIDYGSAFSSPLTDNYEGEALKIAFNPKLLLSILAVEKQKEYTFKFIDASSAMIINEEILLMPLMLSNE